ncbi:MAG TPA: TRAP transporter large permease subunit [Alphaproteobacteria bacterium]
MDGVDVGLISIIAVLVFVYLGVHIGVALSLVSFACIWLVRGDLELAGKMLALAAAESLRSYEFGVIPLFVLMGLFVSIADIGRDTYQVANHLFRRVGGGLGMATVAANTVFAAVTGTSIASASVFTKIAVPEMLRFGYNPRFAVGVVAGSSVLGMLIPPSLLLILFGILAETSIGDLFIAGILPGVTLAVAYGVLILVMSHRFPRSVVLDPTRAAPPDSQMGAVEIAGKLAPMILLIIAVLGGLYGGVFTATEAGGVGALGAFLLALARRRLNWRSLWQVLVETGHVTAAICFLLIAAFLYSRMISVTGIPNAMEAAIISLDFGYYGIIAIYVLIIVLLGTILDAGSIMLIMVPLAIPALASFNLDLTWFGVVTVIAVEIGLLTPPLGLAVFVVHNTLSDDRISVNDIFMGALPFATVMLLVLILIVLVPWVAVGLT